MERVKVWPGVDTDGVYLGLHDTPVGFVRVGLTPAKARRMAISLLQTAQIAEEQSPLTPDIKPD